MMRTMEIGRAIDLYLGELVLRDVADALEVEERQYEETSA